MKYQLKPVEVDAFPFDGTFVSVIAAQDWLSSLDITDCEVSSQGDSEPYALDLTHGMGLYTIEKGSWLIARQGRVYPASAETFKEDYEAAGT